VWDAAPKFWADALLAAKAERIKHKQYNNAEMTC
jgi:hypothetical protein